MKKRVLIALAIVVAFVLFIVSRYSTNRFSIALSVDASGGKEIASYDSHGGFHGDGLTFVSWKFTDDKVRNQILESRKWNVLPLTDNLNRLITEAYICDENGDRFFPDIQNGYYLFIDRHSESRNSSDDSDVFHRYSFNFTLAIYDTDNDILYYAELDT